MGCLLLIIFNLNEHEQMHRKMNEKKQKFANEKKNDEF